MGAATVTVIGPEIQINRILHPAEVDSRVEDNLAEAVRVRVVRADREGVLSADAASARVGGGESWEWNGASIPIRACVYLTLGKAFQSV